MWTGYLPTAEDGPLPDGGTAYYYNVDGLETVYKIPPPGLDFATASAAQLAEYGVPPLPGDKAERTAMLHRFHLVTPPPFLVRAPARVFSNPKWARWIAAANVQEYYSAEIDYKEPQLYSSVAPLTQSYRGPGWGDSTAHNLHRTALERTPPGSGSIKFYVLNVQCLYKSGYLVWRIC